MELNEIVIGLIFLVVGWVLNKLGVTSSYESGHHDDDGFSFHFDFDGDDD